MLRVKICWSGSKLKLGLKVQEEKALSYFEIHL